MNAVNNQYTINNKYYKVFIVSFFKYSCSCSCIYIYSHVFAAHQLIRVTFASTGIALDTTFFFC